MSHKVGNMVSSGTYIRLGSEADCRFSCISETAEFGSESGTHSLMNSTQKKESQLVVSWLLHASDWRLTSCHPLLPRTSQSTLCGWSGDLFSWALPWHHRHLQQAVNAIQEWTTRNGLRFAAYKCKVVHFTALRYKAQRHPPPRHNQDQWHTSASWEINKIPWAVVGYTPLLQRAHQCTKDSAQGGSQSHPSGCTLEVGRGQRHCWCCTGPLFFPSLITDVLCMAQHPIPIYDNLTASTTLG